MTGGRYQSTDDAYAQAATVSISANVGGRVSEIAVRDNELVQRGATLLSSCSMVFLEFRLVMSANGIIRTHGRGVT